MRVRFLFLKKLFIILTAIFGVYFGLFVVFDAVCTVHAAN